MGRLDELAKSAGELVRSFRDGNSGEDDDGPDVSPDDMQAALKNAGLSEATEERPRALFHDPYAVMDWGGWREKPTSLTYESLRQMAQKNTAIAAIIQLRTSQIGQHCKPQQDRYDKGFKVQLRDRRDQSRSMSKQEQMQAAMIERMLSTTGFLLPDERPSDRDSFRTFVKKAVRDVLIYDQWSFEKIRDRSGKISRFIQLPSETIRPAVADIEHMDPRERHGRVSHVQVYEDTVIAEFSPEDIAWCVMNPRSDLRANGFGFSPVEQLINLVTAWLFGFEYNQRFFTQGSAIKGILNIKGAIPDRQLKAFRRLFYGMISGINNAWRTPILNSEDIQFHSMHSTNREMEFSAWMDFLTKLICAVFGMDPIEINFIYGNTGQKGGMNQSRPKESELAESKDKGLRPLMEHIEDSINSHIIWELNPDFEFGFVGLDAKGEGKQREAWDTESKAYKTIDEVRAEMDLPPLKDGSGEVVRDSVWLQAKQAEAMADGEGGGEGDSPFGGDGPMGELPGDEPDGGDDDGEDQDFGGPDEGEDVTANTDQEAPPKPTEMEDAEKALAKLTTLVPVAEDPMTVLRKATTRRRVRGDKQVFDIELGD